MLLSLKTKLFIIPRRINNNAMEQRLKSYDYFISHSSIDYENVQKLIYELNNKRKNVYCDWINDTDYLKRKLVCDATLMVIRKRIEQSKAIIWVESQESSDSIWVKYELNYAQRLKLIEIMLKIYLECIS